MYNLAYINNRSRDANLSFWNYFHSGWRVDVCGPTEGKTAWQMYASALHGSRGLLHFILTGGPGDIPNPHQQALPSPPQPHLTADASKLALLMRLLEPLHASGERVVVCSTFRKSLDLRPSRIFDLSILLE